MWNIILIYLKASAKLLFFFDKLLDIKKKIVPLLRNRPKQLTQINFAKKIAISILHF